MAKDALETLHTAIIDARAGYETAIEKAGDQQLQTVLREMHTLHGAAHADIHKSLVAYGERPDESGSLMASVHKAAISVRSAVTGIDSDSLSSFASGEENIIEKYDDAIVEQDGSAAADRLRIHRGKLAEKIMQMKQMAT